MYSSFHNLILNIFLALTPFRVANVAQLIVERLHWCILNSSTGFELGISMFSGICDSAQLHRQPNPPAPVCTADTQQAAKQGSIVCVSVQFSQPDVPISLGGD